MWLHMTEKRLNKDDSGDLTKNTAKLNMQKWPAPLLKFYMGELTVGELIAAAPDPDPVTDKGQRCEVNFYLAEDDLMHQRKAAARTKLQTAKEICPKTFVEYGAALAELHRLGPASPASAPAKKAQ
jgi:lipoprotein NlpI